MKGFVPTPKLVVDLMVERLFQDKPPTPKNALLDPGCGTGPFIEGVIRWCEKRRQPPPRIVGVEHHPGRAAEARKKFRSFSSVKIFEADFLQLSNFGQFDYIIGNPPYVPITQLFEREKNDYRSLFFTATGRFDLYFLFFERALGQLRNEGRLVFITPEKFMYVSAASNLRQHLGQFKIEEIRLVEEKTFGSLVTYPAISVVSRLPSAVSSLITKRDGTQALVTLPRDGSSWLSAFHSNGRFRSSLTLADISIRVSCGVATGADPVYVQRNEKLTGGLERWAYHTISGTQLAKSNGKLAIEDAMLVPYDERGELKPLSKLGALERYLSKPAHRDVLAKRTCVRRKPWYAFHENPPMEDLLRPKILCRDITDEARFWLDSQGSVIPRHSVYYIVLKDSKKLREVAEYLNSPPVAKWLRGECQRAANGYLRLQSTVLKKLPIPSRLAK